MQTVAVGSKNPVKVRAVKAAFEAVWPDRETEVVSLDEDSFVADQPLSDEETIEGAVNRARGALEEASADFGVGIEGGMVEVKGLSFARAWVAVRDKRGLVGLGCSLSAEVGGRVLELVKEGQELGEAIDGVTGQENLKQKGGYFGLVSGEKVNREHAYTDAVVMALGRFSRPELF